MECLALRVEQRMKFVDKSKLIWVGPRITWRETKKLEALLLPVILLCVQSMLRKYYQTSACRNTRLDVRFTDA